LTTNIGEGHFLDDSDEFESETEQNNEVEKKEANEQEDEAVQFENTNATNNDLYNLFEKERNSSINNVDSDEEDEDNDREDDRLQ